jgi:hypothetical protein
MINAGLETYITGHVGGVANEDIVNGGSNHSGIRMVTVHIFKSRLLGNLIQNLQKKAEADIPLQRLVQYHEATPQFRIALEGKYLVVGCFVRSGHDSPHVDQLP